jgi:hypothetical protein
MEKVQINLALTSAQLRGCAALVRNMSPADIERVACESGEAECIFSALDELQWALMFCSDDPSNESEANEGQRV